ncbi:MAG: GLPGLI family protein [Saprospiraceae bacterium]|nr:GLPGLI family protein [Saprospiraceae bacterium]
MKIVIFLILMFFSDVVANGQTTQGVIKYTQTTYFDFENMPSDMPNMPSDMPKSQDAFMKLTFSDTESIYEKDPDIVVEESANDNVPRMFRRMKEKTNRIYYKNLEEDFVLEQLAFFNKDFVIKDSVASIRWKISAGEQKSILGYNCMKAMYKDSTTNIIAFFTHQIPVSFGPEKFGKLPGLILEIQSATNHTIATEVKMKPLENPIVKPAKGDMMSRDEFEKLRKEKMKEQKEMWGRRDGRPGRQ